MKKGYFLGVLTVLCAFFFMGSLQINNSFKNEQAISEEFTNIYRYLNAPTFRVDTTTPTPSQLSQGQPVWVISNGQVSLFTDINGSTYSVTLGRK